MLAAAAYSSANEIPSYAYDHTLRAFHKMPAVCDHKHKREFHLQCRPRRTLQMKFPLMLMITHCGHFVKCPQCVIISIRGNFICTGVGGRGEHCKRNFLLF